MRSLPTDYLTNLLADPAVRDALAKAIGTAALEDIVRLDAARIVTDPSPRVMLQKSDNETLTTASGVDDLVGLESAQSIQPDDPAMVAAQQTVPETPPLGMPEPLLRAALRYNFDLGSVAPEKDAIRVWLLRHSALSAAAGAKYLRLFNSERQRVLNSPDARERLTALLAETENDDNALLKVANKDMDGLADAYLRHFLRGNGVAQERMLIANHRRAIAAAREELEGVNGLSAAVPSLGECRRRAGLAEILMPLGILIGVDPNETSASAGDRFAGRAEELRILRGLVDELDSQSVIEAVGRGLDRFRRDFRKRPRLMTLTARGGLGKTALMAKFLYDHATQARQQFPFSYLDFDRSDIQPRSANLMLLEICRQLSFQYANIEVPLQQLSQQIRAACAGRDTSSLKTWCKTLRQIVESAFAESGAATFLVVLDTMEIVEPDAAAMEGVTTLLRELAGDLDDPFAELCIVAAGRSGLDQLAIGESYEITALPLKALSVEDAHAMVDQLGRKLLQTEWKDSWPQRIAGKKKDRETRREPLSLRIAVEMVRDTVPARRDAVVDVIARLGENADKAFVAGLYERRILDHVRDERARKLAWPGLIARKVTRTIARDVLAPVCGLTPAEAETAFDLLSREGWLVEGQSDGETIRHRRELRARTIPLMRRHDPEKFSKVVEALIAFYAERDPVEHAYYVMLRGDAQQIYGSRSLHEFVVTLGPDIEDFAPGSPAWNLIQAKTATRSLDYAEMSALPENLLWEHLGRTGTGLRGMNDRRIEPRVRFLAQSSRPATFQDPVQESAWQAIQIKCGFWTRLDPNRLTIPVLQFDLTQFAFYIAQLSVAGERPSRFWGERYPELIDTLYKTRGSDNWHALTLSLITARLYDRRLFDHIESRLLEPLAGASGQGRMRESSLRFLLLVGVVTQPLALKLWIKAEIDRIASGISLAEYALLSYWAGEQISPERPGAHRARELATSHKSTIERGHVEDIPTIILKDTGTCADAADLLDAIGGLYDQARVRQFVRQYCSVRQPEWIVPFAYLLDSLLPDTWRSQIGHEFSLDRYAPSSAGLLSQVTSVLKRPRMPSDMMELLTLTDRAGDFERVTERLSALIDPSRQADIQLLHRVRRAARSWVIDIDMDQSRNV
ncbi:hypothetical protein ACU8MI_26165 (plasmid) [Rhizobium leguminosarum]